MATGRTPTRFARFVIKDSGAVLREVPVNTIGGIGLAYPEIDLTAFQDAVQGFLTGIPGFALEFGGPFDTTAAVAASGSGVAPALSGSHTVLNPVNGLLVPLSWGMYFGIRAIWATGDPVFGISSSAVNGVIVTNYQVMPDADGLKYTARIAMYAGSAIPTWGTAAVV